MNDYLSHLAVRSLPQADVILPRPSSLFETAVSPTDVINLEEETVTAPQPPVTQSSQPPPITAAHQPQLEVEPAVTAVAQPIVNNQEPITPNTPPLPPWLQQLQSLTQKPPRAVEPTIPTSHEVENKAYSSPVMSEKNLPASTTVVTPPIPNQTETPFPVTPPAKKIIERQQTETRLVERIEPKPLISETIIEQNVYPPADPQPPPLPPKKSLVSPSQHDGQKVIMPETRPYIPPAQPPRSDQQVEQTSPTIHVTIGRVEVRATKPTATPKERPRRARAPVMSLDDYLRQRANGENQ